VLLVLARGREERGEGAGAFLERKRVPCNAGARSLGGFLLLAQARRLVVVDEALESRIAAPHSLRSPEPRPGLERTPFSLELGKARNEARPVAPGRATRELGPCPGRAPRRHGPGAGVVRPEARDEAWERVDGGRHQHGATVHEPMAVEFLELCEFGCEQESAGKQARRRELCHAGQNECAESYQTRAAAIE